MISDFGFRQVQIQSFTNQMKYAIVTRNPIIIFRFDFDELFIVSESEGRLIEVSFHDFLR